MSGINRRELFLGAGGVLATIRTRSMSAADFIPPAPIARVAVVKDTYFGETLSDPYRWMENDKDAEWLPFLKGQNAHTRAVLGRIPGRAALLRRIQQLSGDTVVTRHVQRAGGKLSSSSVRRARTTSSCSCRRATDRSLVDPTLKSRAGLTPVARLVASPPRTAPGSLRALQGWQRGSVLHVLTGRRRADLPDAIPGTEDGQSAVAR